MMEGAGESQQRSAATLPPGIADIRTHRAVALLLRPELGREVLGANLAALEAQPGVRVLGLDEVVDAHVLIKGTIMFSAIDIGDEFHNPVRVVSITGVVQ